MSEKERVRKMIPDFKGLFSNVDPTDADNGEGISQTNLTSHVTGELRVRSGMQPITYEN